MSDQEPRESPENRTFRIEGWLFVMPLVLLLIGILLAWVLPFFLPE